VPLDGVELAGGGAALGVAGGVAGALGALPGVVVAPPGAALLAPLGAGLAPPAAPGSAGFSGWTWVTVHSIAARFSSGVVGPPFSNPRQSTLAILPSPATNAWLPLAVNVYFARYSKTP